MARIEWAQLCEKAFVDDCDRLCLIGITTRMPVPSLPNAVHQLMIVARVVELRVRETIDVGVSITTPSGHCPSPNDPDCLDIEVVADYILVTLRDLPLAEEGIYSFGISLGADPPVTITVPVLLQPRPAHVRVH
jgi:hypothetical protein